MGEFFADIHASAASQLGTQECLLSDSEQVMALRGAKSYEELLQLGDALCFQLRYREAVKVYSKAVDMVPSELSGVRKRAARYITTLQPEKAVEDFLRCRALGGDELDISYRLGISYYLAGDYSKAMAEFETCISLCDDEMAIAAIFWHTLSAWREGRMPKLLYCCLRDNMNVGHHTAYAFAMELAAEKISLMKVLDELEAQQDDLEYSIMAYGAAEFMDINGLDSGALRQSILARDSFWISFCYIAAWNDRDKMRNK